jgi:serpin B
MLLGAAAIGCSSSTVEGGHDEPTPESSGSSGSSGSVGSTGSGSGSGSSVSGGSGSSASIVREDVSRKSVPSSDANAAVAANNAFALALYGELSPAANGGNFLTSPISADLALTMTYAGAQGETATQMASVLHIPPSGTSIFDAQNALTSALNGRAATALGADTKTASQNGGAPPSPSDYALQVVNAVWGQTGYPWETPFLDILAESYGTGVYVEDFRANPSSAESAINAWVDTATSGKINPLLAPGAVTTDTRMVLVNAIHVKLPWQSPFETSATQPGTFTRGDGSTVQAQMMSQSFGQDTFPAVNIGYQATSAGQFLSLPLSGGQLSVVFALPTTDLASLASSLTATSFSPPTTGDYVNLTLPKFSYTTNTFSLAAALASLGMTDAFNRDLADFRGICANPPDGDNLYIQDVLQKATLDVAENGVEAAAATAVLVGGAAVATENPPPTINLVFDKPFMVSIVDATGAVLFLGQIDDPTATGG